MKTFSQCLDSRRVEADPSNAGGDNAFVFTVDDGWQQGRGAFGGLVVGAMVRAADVVTGDAERKVRSVTAEILGPVLVGDVTLRIERLRQGAGVSAVRVRMIQNDDELACAVVVFGKTRPNIPAWSTTPPPALLSTLPPWSSLEVSPVTPPLAPTFTQHFDFRVTGHAPGVAAAEATASGFIQPRRHSKFVDAAVVCGCADAWWPAAMARFDSFRPTATITYALEVCCDLAAVDGAAPLFHEAESSELHEGYAVEHRRLWTPAGKLVAQNQQVFAVIR